MAVLRRNELAESFKQQAKERQREHGKTAPGRKKTLVQPVVQVKDDLSSRTVTKLGRVAGVSRETIRQAAAVKASDPALAEKVASGKKSVKQAHKEERQTAGGKKAGRGRPNRSRQPVASTYSDDANKTTAKLGRVAGVSRETIRQAALAEKVASGRKSVKQARQSSRSPRARQRRSPWPW
jgi:DNA-directed RNA polymerase sigma subunit (sigma70/sigma32)